MTQQFGCCHLPGEREGGLYVSYEVHPNFRSSLAHQTYTNDRGLPAGKCRYG